MPIDQLDVSGGRLSVWHRFDVKDKALVKDRNFMMALADTNSGAILMLNACWNKFGYVGSPPNRTYFTRADGGLNKAETLPGTPSTAPTLNSRTAFRIQINIDLDTPSKGGSYPEYVRVKAVKGTGGPDLVLDSPVSYPLTNTAVTVNTLEATTAYNISYALVNAAGAGAYSPSALISTL